MALKKRDVGEWGKIKIAPGEERDVKITVSESYSGVDIRVPAYVWRSANPGPTVFITGAIHGDEINGTGIIRSIIVDRPFELKCGNLIMVPVVNIPGFERNERYMPDRRDLNRSFPGSKRGSLSKRLARAIYDEIVSRSDFGIDLHTAAIRRTNFPNIRADMECPGMPEFARAFGSELIVGSKGPVGSMRRAATTAGCPTIILEAGEVWKVEPVVVEYGIRGVVNCLRHFGMVEGKLARPPFLVETDATQWVRAQFGGFLRFHVTPGDLVKKGDPLATNISLVGKKINITKAPRSGIVLGMSTIPSVSPGDPICHLAYTKKGEFSTVGRTVNKLEDDALHERMKESLSQSVFVDRKP